MHILFFLVIATADQTLVLELWWWLGLGVYYLATTLLHTECYGSILFLIFINWLVCLLRRGWMQVFGFIPQTNGQRIGRNSDTTTARNSTKQEENSNRKIYLLIPLEEKIISKYAVVRTAETRSIGYVSSICVWPTSKATHSKQQATK